MADELTRTRSNLVACESRLVDAQRQLTEKEKERVRLQAHVESLQKQLADAATPSRRRLPDTRQSTTRKFKVLRDGEEELAIYVTAGVYEDGSPGELFLKCDRQGSLTSGALDAVAMTISLGLQHGVPLKAYVDKLVAMRFDPSGFTGDAKYRSCTSILDLVARWLRDHFKLPTE